MAEEEIQIVSKYDYELSKSEVKKIFKVYNECFYNNLCSGTKNIKKCQILIANSHLWRWYLAYLGSELIGIAAYVYDHSKINDLDVQVNHKVGENVCNVGVLEKFRRRGIARCLMEQIMDDYSFTKKIVVEVILGTDQYLGIMNLYVEKLGFKPLFDGKFDNDQVRYLIFKH